MHRKFHAAVIVCLALIVPGPAFGEESVDMAIRGRAKQFEAAYNAGDAEALAAIYAVDATHTYALGFTHRGRVEIARGLREQFAGPFKGTQMTVKPLHIRAICPEVAVEEASFVLSGLRNADGADLPPVNGFCLAVYRREGEQWYAVAVQCMVPPPAPQPK
jgi:uncharacterized protein (TIGR02246 family)